MEFVEIIIILFIALIIAALFAYGFRRRGPWGAFWVFLLFLFLAAWAARLWVTPAGPIVWGVAWLPIVFFVFIIALIIAAASPREDYRVPEATPATDREVAETGAAFGLFFWILLIFFIIAIVVGLLQ
jgi:hypothetical protein